MSFFSRLKEGLKKTSSGLGDTFTHVFTGQKLDESMLEDLEDALIQADIGVETSAHLIKELKKTHLGHEVGAHEVRQALAEKIETILTPCEGTLSLLGQGRPRVILMVGVNGSGKTTTIGKLAAILKAQGVSVMLAAGDTFRAGAVDQLDVWAKRVDVPICRPLKEGADPASTIFNAYEQAKEHDVDILIADTAGRLQNRKELMDELAKITRVLKKQDENAPHATLLTLDATVGQNAHSQVEIFNEVAQINGLVVTKLDSTAKGGVVVALAKKFGLPIPFVGIGEKVEDLRTFNAHDYANALVGLDESTS